MFGFSFKGDSIRQPFKSIVDDLTALSASPADQRVKILSVDVPSGWDVEQGNKLGTFDADCLVSLTAPKLCAQYHQGSHYLGGRFCPADILAKYECAPPDGLGYEGMNQVCKLS